MIYHLLQAGLCSGRDFRLLPVAIDHPRQVMAFNTPAELCETVAYYREKQRDAAVWVSVGSLQSTGGPERAPRSDTAAARHAVPGWGSHTMKE